MFIDRPPRLSGSTWHIFVFGFLLVHDDLAALTWSAKEKSLQSESDCLKKIIGCTQLGGIGRNVPGKMVRMVESLDDADDYNEGITTKSQVHAKDEKNNSEMGKGSNETITASNVTEHSILQGHRTITISLRMAGGIIVITVLVTCCCTLFIRSKCIKIMHKFRGKKKSSKFMPADVERGKSTKRRLSSKTLQAFGRKQPSYETVNAGTQHSLEQRDLETRAATSSTGCFRCSKKKKRRKNAKAKR